MRPDWLWPWRAGPGPFSPLWRFNAHRPNCVPGASGGQSGFCPSGLIDGLSSSPVAVDFILDTGADGILTTKPSLIRRAKALGLLAVQRFFLLDSMALENISRHLKQDAPDLIEVLPGLMPQVIGQLAGGPTAR